MEIFCIWAVKHYFQVQLSLWNVASKTGELNFKFYLILINLDSYLWLGTTVSQKETPEGLLPCLLDVLSSCDWFCLFVWYEVRVSKYFFPCLFAQDDFVEEITFSIALYHFCIKLDVYAGEGNGTPL